MNIKNFTIAFAIIFFIYIGIIGALYIAVFPQMSWKMILFLIFAISLITTVVLSIVGAKNKQQRLTASLEICVNCDTSKHYIIRLLCLSVYVFIVSIILAYMHGSQREFVDIATSAAWATCWIFLWGWILRIIEVLMVRYWNRNNR